MVSIDLYRNETTRHAHIILPPCGPLERDHFDLAFQLFSVRNFAYWSPAVFDPTPDTRSDADILIALASRLHEARGGLHRLQGLALRGLETLGATRASRLAMDVLLRAGPYGNGLRPWRPGLTMKRLRAAVHGVDLGPLEPCLPARLPKRPDRTGQRIDLAPREIIADMERLRQSVEAGTPDSLVMIGRREARTVNSWSHNLPSLVTGPPRCVLHMHPRDAKARGIGPEDWVSVTSRVGTVDVPVRLTDTVMPGVVALPHGDGHRGDGIRLQVAAAHAGVSLNDLTDPAEIDPLSGNAVLSGIPVCVERCPSRA